MLKQIFSFQKLMFINVFQFNSTKPDVDKSKNSGFKADFTVGVLLILSAYAIYLCDTYLGILAYLPMLFGLIDINATFITGKRLLFKTLPIKSSFVVANLIFLYPIYFFVFWTVILVPFAIGYIVEDIGRIVKSIFLNSAVKLPEFYLFSRQTGVKAVLFAFLAGLCIFVLMWLYILFTQSGSRLLWRQLPRQ